MKTDGLCGIEWFKANKELQNASREKWDVRFLELAKFIASWSKDPSTKTGAVIVRPNKSVASVGFNGFPTKLIDSEKDYSNRDVKYSKIIHCEMNALLFAREQVTGYTLYTYPLASCERCAVHMIQAGITRCVFPKIPHDQQERWQDSVNRTKTYLTEAEVDWREVDFE